MSRSNDIDEVLQVTSQVLVRCLAIGIIMLLFWWGALSLTGDLAYRIHSRVVLPVSREQFVLIHYTGILLAKAVVFLLFFSPYAAVRLVISKRRKQSSG